MTISVREGIEKLIEQGEKEGKDIKTVTAAILLYIDDKIDDMWPGCTVVEELYLGDEFMAEVTKVCDAEGIIGVNKEFVEIDWFINRAIKNEELRDMIAELREARK